MSRVFQSFLRIANQKNMSMSDLGAPKQVKDLSM